MIYTTFITPNADWFPEKVQLQLIFYRSPERQVRKKNSDTSFSKEAFTSGTPTCIWVHLTPKSSSFHLKRCCLCVLGYGSHQVWKLTVHYSNRILIHIWSALPSLTVWSEFASDWQLLRDGRLQLGFDWLFSSGLWNLADTIRSTGGHRRTQRHMIFFQITCLMHYCQDIVTIFIKITFFFNHICSISTHCSFNGLPPKNKSRTAGREKETTRVREPAYFHIKLCGIRVYFDQTRVGDCWKD